tara:strand:+ start:256 stop:693 length:438 start_codon:yes stop_codon:yes gene_type:complete
MEPAAKKARVVKRYRSGLPILNTKKHKLNSVFVQICPNLIAQIIELRKSNDDGAFMIKAIVACYEVTDAMETYEDIVNAGEPFTIVKASFILVNDDEMKESHYSFNAPVHSSIRFGVVEYFLKTYKPNEYVAKNKLREAVSGSVE